MKTATDGKPTLLVLASTYPRWLEDPEPGFVHELARRLTTCFHVVVLCPHAKGSKPAEVMDDVEVIRYRYAPAGLETLVNNGGIVTNLRNHRSKLLLVPCFVLMQAWHAWRICRQRKVAVIHAHWLIPQGLIAALLQCLQGPRISFVATSHGADLYALRARPLQTLKRFVLRRADSVTVVSSAMRTVVDELGGDLHKVHVLPMGVDMVHRFVPGDALQRASSELLFVGRLVEKKGLRYLLDALPTVIKARPDVRLTIAGFGPDEAALKARAAELGLQDVVRFLGAVTQKQLPELYQHAALFVAPFVKASSGDQEGLPVALMEAVACGCPAIAGDVAGLRDIFGLHAYECIVDPCDCVALSTAILNRLCNSQHAREQALAMRETLVEQLGWEHIASRYAALLEQAGR